MQPGAGAPNRPALPSHPRRARHEHPHFAVSSAAKPPRWSRQVSSSLDMMAMSASSRARSSGTPRPRAARRCRQPDTDRVREGGLRLAAGAGRRHISTVPTRRCSADGAQTCPATARAQPPLPRCRSHFGPNSAGRQRRPATRAPKIAPRCALPPSVAAIMRRSMSRPIQSDPFATAQRPSFRLLPLSRWQRSRLARRERNAAAGPDRDRDAPRCLVGRRAAGFGVKSASSRSEETAAIDR